MTEEITKFEFQVEELYYKLWIGRFGGVSFGLVGGFSPKGKYEVDRDTRNLWPEDDHPMLGDVNLHQNALTVFLKVKEIVLKYMHVNRPNILTFSATTPRKAKLYLWLANRLLKEIDGYKTYEYPKGTIVIYKMQQVLD